MISEYIYIPAKVSPGGLREAYNQATAKRHSKKTGSNSNLEQIRQYSGLKQYKLYSFLQYNVALMQEDASNLAFRNQGLFSQEL